MAITIYFIATSLPDHLASIRDAFLLKHPKHPALKDVESNLRSVASASGAVPPPLFHRCTVPPFSTFTASLATAATDMTAAVVTTSARSRARSGRRGDQGAGGSRGGGGGVAGGVGGSAGVGGLPGAASSDSPTADGGGAARQQQQQQQPLLSQRPQQQQGQQQGQKQGSGPCQLSRGDAHPPCPYINQTSTRSGFRCDRHHPPGQCFAQLTDTLRVAYGVDGPAPNWLPFVHSHGSALWAMSASQFLDLLGTPHAMYAVVDSSTSDSVYSRVFSLGASVDLVPVVSVGTCLGTIPGAAPEDASLSFNVHSGASHCFFRDHTTLTPLPAPVSMALADPTSRLVIARYTTTLPCPAVPSGFLTGFHVTSFSRNLVGVRPLVGSHVGVWFEPSRDSATCVDGDTYAQQPPQPQLQEQQQQQPPPVTDLRTVLFRSSPPRSSPSVLPSPPESALTASISTPVTDYYRTYHPVLSHVLASLVTHPRASLSSVSALTAAITEFATTRRLDYDTRVVAAPPTSPLAVGCESALGCDALED
ncbi:unnamed protein product [Closterium sp. NIES-54]